jgi:hypothetical protein
MESKETARDEETGTGSRMWRVTKEYNDHREQRRGEEVRGEYVEGDGGAKGCTFRWDNISMFSADIAGN